jgi:acetyl esterase/lipase
MKAMRNLRLNFPLIQRTAAALAVSACLLSAADKKVTAGSPENFNIPLWEESKVPGSLGDGPLDKPFLTVFQPPVGKRNGGSVIIAPGGSNIMLMYGAEGVDFAEKYNEWGVTAFVLSYRMSPKYGGAARSADGKRAVQLVRSRASQFGLDPAKVGFIGFSAGGNLVRPFMATAGPGDPNAADPVDRMNSRPDYLALVYGASGGGPNSSTPEALKGFPPTFLISAQGDQGPSLTNATFFAELTRARVPAELHIYQDGRHGFGLGEGSYNLGDWVGRLKHFLEVREFIPGAKK